MQLLRFDGPGVAILSPHPKTFLLEGFMACTVWVRFGHALGSYGVRSGLGVFSFVFFWTDGCLVHHKNLDLYLISYGESVDFVGFVSRPRRMGETTLKSWYSGVPVAIQGHFFLNQRISYFFVIFVAFCWYKLRCRYVRNFFFHSSAFLFGGFH